MFSQFFSVAPFLCVIPFPPFPLFPHCAAVAFLVFRAATSALNSSSLIG